MRWNQSVIDRKGSNKRQSNTDERDASSSRDGERYGNQEDKSYFKECRKTYDQADTHHGPRNTFFAEDTNEGEGDGVGSAGFGHHFAEHRSQCDDDGNVAEDVADAHFKRVDDIGHGHPRNDGESEGCEQQAEEGVELKDRDEKDDPDDRAEGTEQEKDAVRIDHRLIGSAVL